jgi:hypothetical protein
VIELLGLSYLPSLHVTFTPFTHNVTSTSVLVPDAMPLLLKGFETLLARKYEDRVVDREDRRRFEKHMHEMIKERLSHNSFISESVIAPLTTPAGQYYPAPNNRDSSLLSPMAQASPLMYLPTQYHPPARASFIPHASPQTALNPLAQEFPFLATMTKTSHCSKFKKFIEDFTSLEMCVDGIKSTLDMVLSSHFSFVTYNEWETY